MALLAVGGGVAARFKTDLDPYSLHRTRIWAASLGAVVDAPWRGAGPGQFAAAAANLNFPLENAPLRYERSFKTPHSDVLRAFCEFGIPAGLAAVAAAAMLALAAIPGFPAWPFAVVGAALAIPGALHLRAVLAERDGAARGAATERGGPGRPFDLDRTQALVDALAVERPVLVRETVPRLVGLPALADLLALMRDDGLDETRLGELLEALARDGGKGSPIEVAERLRRRMAAVITARLVGAARTVDVAVLERDVEAVLDSALCTTADGARLALPEADLRGVVAAVEAALRPMDRPVLLVPPRVRRPLSAALGAHGVAAEVIAHGELEGDVEVRIAARISV
jgi:flagellar biosynthesis component FlhA